ncbi:MAG: methylenetetrahydrofolate--tRNA-(uracil(54)-C(5))-methyltransferase (FADH(2)-oxidizing) TrmFO [Hyphomicrobiaceae bacterium]|nr:methylenetetrahydrofolate--tRNA-(uracil(54)-C(5))-methyltransferase (FADH(2)-oxidizing) TrmFO [Hyphomicrobiaceae bacterium]
MNITNFQEPIHIIGAGLAGSEAAWQAASYGVQVILHEMRPLFGTEVHQTEYCAELVCSNSFRSDDSETSAAGVLHAEMRLADSLIMSVADKYRLPAGGALAVDRQRFATGVTATLEAHPLIKIVRGEIVDLPPEHWDNVIITTGPLTSEALAEAIIRLTGKSALAFFDAIAPIVYYDSIDLSTAWRQSRYNKEGPAGNGADYLNCPMDEVQYNLFIDALLKSDKVSFKTWEDKTPYFDGCLPIEVMAERGRDTLRYGPMKPVGLINPNFGAKRPFAVAQLRQDNEFGTLWNMVGFQTKLRYGEQKRIFRTIPGLENAEFARLGGMHRNTFLNSPLLLDKSLRLRNQIRMRFAGQITGVEGYSESAACGLMAGTFAAAEWLGQSFELPPPTSAHGALLAYVTGGSNAGKKRNFQPMNMNFGLIPSIEVPKQNHLRARLRGKMKSLAKKKLQAARAIDEWTGWLNIIRSDLRKAKFLKT